MTKLFDVEFTHGAEADLEALHAYITAHRPQSQANSLLDDIIRTIATMETHPERGSLPKELEDLGIKELRQILSAPYRLIYRIIGRRVVITVIADGRRDMAALLERRILGR